MVGFVVAFTAIDPASHGFELTWSAPEPCPSGDDVARGIAETLGDDAESAAPSPIQAHAEIVSDARGYTLRLRLGQGSEIREITGSSCDELAATAAFIVAIAVDPRALGRGAPTIVHSEPPPVDAPTPDVPIVPPPPPEPALAPRRAPAGPTSPPVVAPPSRRASRSTTLGGRVLAGFGLGPSPAITGLVGASIGALGPAFRVEIEGQYWAPRTITSRRNREVDLVAQLWSVGVRGCGVLGRNTPARRIEAALCGVAQAGAIHGKGAGALASRQARVPWAGAGAGVILLGWIRPHIGIACGIDVLASVVRAGFRSEPSGDIDRVGPIAVTGTCGPIWRAAAVSPRSTRSVLERPGAGQSGG